MDRFKTREPIESVHTFNKTENIEELKKLLNELADLGWDSNQWSSMLPDYDDEVLLELEPKFNEFTDKEKSCYFRDNIEKLPRYYFIESFGHPEYGYLRGEGKSLVECAKKIIKRGKQQNHCTHNWAYTHKNGFKTCTDCHSFVSCTVDEAIANYPKGEVKVNDQLTLYFHNSRSICTCGSSKMYFLQHSMLYEKQYQCAVCYKYWPQKFKKIGQLKFSRLPVSPNDDDYESASAEYDDTTYNRHRFISFGVMSQNTLKYHITKYVGDMLKHFHFVENGESISEFVSWVKSYVHKAVVNTKTQIVIDDKKYELLGIKDLEITINMDNENEKFVISYDLDVKEPVKENDDDEVVLKSVFDAILNNEE